MSGEQRPYFSLYIDVFGFCNLRCPSCPVGNIGDTSEHFTKGFMSPELLDAILEKANREMQLGRVGLFNWTEPLLHPDLPAMIRVVRARGNFAEISSNLNRLPDPDALMAARPNFFRVSVSGFRQEIYKRAHQRGDIEVVKHNMERLAIARAKTGADTAMQVFFHRYNYNRDDEAAMRAFSERLGFAFAPTWAMYMPAEKILSLVGDPAGTVPVTETDRQVVSTLSIDLRQALMVSRINGAASCALLEQQLVLDVRGDVFLCCGTTSSPVNRIGNFLDLGIAEIQAKKREKALCKPCMSHGIHHYFLNQEQFRSLARY
jgi:wyosine [tRNA(Phe)-imidazoG37] synthetase (radical SAM superfamily)